MFPERIHHRPQFTLQAYRGRVVHGVRDRLSGPGHQHVPGSIIDLDITTRGAPVALTGNACDNSWVQGLPQDGFPPYALCRCGATFLSPPTPRVECSLKTRVFSYTVLESSLIIIPACIHHVRVVGLSWCKQNPILQQVGHTSTMELAGQTHILVVAAMGSPWRDNGGLAGCGVAREKVTS